MNAPTTPPAEPDPEVHAALRAEPHPSPAGHPLCPHLSDGDAR